MLTKMLANGSQRVFLNRVDELANRSLRAVENPTFVRQDRHTPLHTNYTALRECMAYVFTLPREKILLRWASAAP